MSERTTIGGVTYESIGSNTSNLLLRCNGTARIQWGNRLIDLIKNGKLAVDNNQITVDVISDLSDIKNDGIYVLSTEQSDQLIIHHNGHQYNLTGTDLYISTSTQQNITVEQKQQALENIGFYYNTLEDVQKAQIQNGIVYVTTEQTLYTIQNGNISEFEAKLKTITVEQTNPTNDSENNEDNEEDINSSIRIVLSVKDMEYMVLADSRIMINYPIYIKNSASLGSEYADQNTGYRLYIQGNTSYLDVDEINVRNGIKVNNYIEKTFSELRSLIKTKTLVPHQWYLIIDFQNHWKLSSETVHNNRPILVRALTKDTLYKQGLLFKDQRVVIHYDYHYQEVITQNKIVNGKGTSEDITTRGRITWMADSNNNSANFDFLNYQDVKGKPLATLHKSEDDSLDPSIFPVGSYNNTLIVTNLKGTVLKDKEISEDDGYSVSFGKGVIMYDNYLKCDGITVAPDLNFYGNIIHNAINLKVAKPIINSKFESLNSCVLNSNFKNTSFQNLTNCTFNEGDVYDVTCRSDINDYEFSQENTPLLYDKTKVKDIYVNNGVIQITTTSSDSFVKGMIIMYSGADPIPDGWAICDGSEHTYNGVTTITPNLVGNFIKAVGNADDVGQKTVNENNQITLTTSNLPEHSHPHKAHSHAIPEQSISIDGNTITGKLNEDVFVDLSNATTNIISGDIGTTITVSTGTGGTKKKPSFEITVPEQSSSIPTTTSEEATSEEIEWQYGDTIPIKIEPNYYALIFIIKL